MKKIQFLFILLLCLGVYGCGQVDNSTVETTTANMETVLAGENTSENIDQNTENNAESADDTMQVISDFLHMDSTRFCKKYKKEELYESGILYCDKDAWKYDGSQLDAFQDVYYNVENITAIRFFKRQPAPIYQNLNIADQTNQYSETINIIYHTDYAVSIYQKPSDGNLPCIEELSFLKVESDEGSAPEALYDFIEDNYYKVMENLEQETWILSPDGKKEVCVSNGELPKHPSQIFVRNKEDKNKPLTVFRRTWEHEIVGWIDNNHFVCYPIDVGMPVLVHLDRNELEPIGNGERPYDTCGAKYTIKKMCLTAYAFGEQLYQWEILECDGEIFLCACHVDD